MKSEDVKTMLQSFNTNQKLIRKDMNKGNF